MSNTAPIRIRLIKMSDPYPLPKGSLGTITGRDDAGDYLVDWDCGSQLKLIEGIDQWELVSPAPQTERTRREEVNTNDR